MNQVAESLGAGLGRLQARYDAWMKQRDGIAAELRDYVSAAQKMLTAIGHDAGVAVSQAVASVKTGRRAGFRMSAEARKKISVAAKARWAKRKAGKKKRNVSPEVRAKLARLARERWAKAKKAGRTSLG